MAPVYADHPFQLIPTPNFLKQSKGETTDLFDDCASEMALVHNIMIRGLNAIYLQAPHVAPGDAKPFCVFIQHWHALPAAHHAGEEADFFADLEAMAGEKGIMAGNVEQHRAFHAGLAALHTYAGACAAGREVYDGARVVRMVDDFGPALVEHLANEVPSIESLRRYGADRMADLPRRFAREARRNMQELGFLGLAGCLAQIDVHHEEDLWIAFPPAPAWLMFLLRNVVWWVEAKALRFGPCDRQGRMKPLYAVPAAEK